MKKSSLAISISVSIFTIALLALLNYLTSRNDLWWPWTIFAFFWWPAAIIAGKKVNTVMFSSISAVVIILYFYFQYSVKTPNAHPWYLYIIPIAVWWPVTVGFRKYRDNFIFLLISLLIFTVYYGLLNYLYSPNYPWIIYPMFVFSWVAILFFFTNKKKPVALSISGATLTIVFFILVNYINSPNVIWAVFPAFAVLWWPLSSIFFKKDHKIKES